MIRILQIIMLIKLYKTIGNQLNTIISDKEISIIKIFCSTIANLPNTDKVNF